MELRHDGRLMVKINEKCPKCSS